MSRAEKTMAVIKALKMAPELSNRAIAEICTSSGFAVTHPTVARIRKNHAHNPHEKRRVGRDGKSRRQCSGYCAVEHFFGDADHFWYMLHQAKKALRYEMPRVLKRRRMSRERLAETFAKQFQMIADEFEDLMRAF